MNFYAFNIGDYAGATRHLSWDEDMAYRRMLDAYYSREAPLPLEPRQIYRLVGAAEPRQREAVDAILEEFFERREDGWHNNRADEEIAKASVKREKARASAMLSVAARQGRSNSEIRQERLTEARAKATHTQAEWEALKEACGGRCVRCGGDGRVEKDHIVPLYQGGSDGIENLQPLCAKCNASKGRETTDHRSPAVQALVQRMLSERSTDASERSTTAAHDGNGRLAPNPNPNPNPNKEDDEEDTRARKKLAFERLDVALKQLPELKGQPVSAVPVLAPIFGLMWDKGLDLDTQILPSIRRQAVSASKPIKGWSYFVPGILQDAENPSPTGAPYGSQPRRRSTPGQDMRDAIAAVQAHVAERD